MKLNSICENRDYRRIYARGKSIVTPQLVIYISKNRKGDLRAGITTSKKIGGAVQRNRAKRIIREAFRQIMPRVKTGYDLIFVARGRTPFIKSTEIKWVLEKQLKSAGILIS